MKTYKIYKKRLGQNFQEVGEIYTDGWIKAKKQFARQMTDDNHNLSNNIQWLDRKEDGVNESGWYDFNGGTPLYNEDLEKYDADEAKDFLMVSEKEINKGFDFWSEDVHVWELRKN